MKTALIVALSIFLLGLFIFLILILKKVKRHKAIKHYEELRDKLSVREVEEETGITEEDYNNYSGSTLGGLVSGFVTILVGALLIGPISKEIQGTVTESAFSLYEVSGNLLQLVPYLFAFTILFIAIGVAYSSLRNAGQC